MIAAMSHGIGLKQCEMWDGCRVVNIASQSCIVGSEASTDLEVNALLCCYRIRSICRNKQLQVV